MISWDSVMGGGNLESMSNAVSLSRILFISIFGISILIFGAWVAVKQRVEEPLQYAISQELSQEIPPTIDDEPLEATLIEDIADDTSS